MPIGIDGRVPLDPQAYLADEAGYNAAQVQPGARYQTDVQRASGFIPTQSSTSPQAGQTVLPTGAATGVPGGSPGVYNQQVAGISGQPSGSTGAYNQPAGAVPQPGAQPGAYTNPTAISAPAQNFDQDDPNSFNIPQFLQPFPFQEQKAEGADFRQREAEYLANLESPEAVRQRFENRYGYQDLVESNLRVREQMRDVQAAAKATPENVASRARSTIVTQAQVDKIVNSEVRELMQTYADLGQIDAGQGERLGRIEQNMNDAAKLEFAKQQRDMLPWLQEYDSMHIMQAREFSGYTFANGLELSRLTANQSAGVTMREGDLGRMNQLAIAEMGFKNSLDQISAQGSQQRLTQAAPRSSSLADIYRSVMG